MRWKVTTLTVLFLFVISGVSAVEGFKLDSEIPKYNFKDDIQQGSSGLAGFIHDMRVYFFGPEEPSRDKPGLESFTVSNYSSYVVKHRDTYYVSKSDSVTNKFLLKHKDNSTQKLSAELGDGCDNLVFDNGALPSKWTDSNAKYEFFSGHQQLIIRFKVKKWDNKTTTSQSCTVSFTNGNQSFEHEFKVKVAGTKYPDKVENFFTTVFGLKGVDLYSPMYICPDGLQGNLKNEKEQSLSECTEPLQMIPVPTTQGLFVIGALLFVAWVVYRFRFLGEGGVT